MTIEKIIYTKRIAYELRKRGFRMVRTDINPNFPQYITYVFENSKELEEALAELSKSR